MNELFWNLVKQLLKEKGITQTSFAESLGISVRTFQDWVYSKYKPDMVTAKEIANRLGVSLDYLLTGDASGSLSSEEANLLKTFRNIAPSHRPLIQDLANQFATNEISRLN